MSNVVAFRPAEPVAESPNPKREGKAVLDDGYTRLANEIKDAKAKLEISGNQFRVLEAIERFTFGWNKSKDRIANTQIAEYCGLDEFVVSKAIKHLVERKVLFAHGDKRKTKTYEINTFVAEWSLSKLTKGLVKTDKMICQNEQDGLSKPTNTKDILSKEKKDNKDLVVGKNPTTAPRSKYQFSDDDMTAAAYMAEQLAKADARAGVPAGGRKPNLESWANTVRLLVERDKRTHRDICRLFKACCEDERESTYTRCPAKLRRTGTGEDNFSRLWRKFFSKQTSGISTHVTPAVNVIPPGFQ